MSFKIVSAIVGLGIIGFLAVTQGCKTVSDGDDGIDPIRFGRLTVTVYLAAKQGFELDEDVVNAVSTVYREFDRLVTNTDDQAVIDFKNLLLKAVASELNTSPQGQALLILANEAIYTYWNQLSTRYNIEGLIGEEQLEILKKFNIGVKTALEEYAFLVTAPKDSE